MRFARLRKLAVAGLCVCSYVAGDAAGVELSRGRQLLLQQGLQIQGLSYPTATFDDFPLWSSAGFTTLDVSLWNYPTALQSLPTTQQWSRLYNLSFPVTEFVNAGELPFAHNLVTYLYGDEFTDAQYADPVVLADMAAHYTQWRQLYPNAQVGTNGRRHIPNDANLANYMQVTEPDLVMFDYYPGFSSFRNFTLGTVSRDRWYLGMQRYREAGLAGNDGSGTTPIPYAQYLNLYRENQFDPVPNESFVRLQHNASWAFGYTSVDSFVYKSVDPDPGVHSVIFETVDDNTPNFVFDYVKEVNRQSRNLSPALVRMVSTGVFMQPGSGQSLPSVPAEFPSTTLSAWSAGAGATTGFTDYITGITPTGSAGGATSTSFGDTLIGYFKPLLADNSGYTFVDGLHFMIVNAETNSGIAGVGSGIPVDGSQVPDAAALAAGSAATLAQWYNIDFDFAASGFDSLVRLSRDTGLVELVALTPEGGSQYSLDLNLPGGTGDLFAFWDSSLPLPTLPKTPLMGDFNANGFVDLDDYQIMKDKWLTTSNGLNINGELTGPAGITDGIIDSYDFLEFKENLYPGGASAFAADLAASSVPEPSTVMLLFVAAPACFLLRFRSGRETRRSVELSE